MLEELEDMIIVDLCTCVCMYVCVYVCAWRDSV
jgi:hypothetical protein